MISKWQILLRLCGVAAVYAVLMATFPLIAVPFSTGLAVAGEVLLQRPGWNAHATFRPARDERGERISITVTHQDTQMQGVTALGVRGRCYTPLAFLLALVCMSPVPWRRRLWAGAISLPMIGLFMLTAMWVVVLNAIVTWPNNAFGVNSQIPPVAEWLYLYTAGVPMTVIVVPLILWAACTFRREDFAGEGKGSEPTTSRRFSTERHRNP